MWQICKINKKSGRGQILLNKSKIESYSHDHLKVFLSELRAGWTLVCRKGRAISSLGAERLVGWGLVGRQPDSSQETEARKGAVPLTLSPYPVLSSGNCSLHRSQLELTGNQIRNPHSVQTSHLNPAPLSAAEYTPEHVFKVFFLSSLKDWRNGYERYAAATVLLLCVLLIWPLS